MGLLIAGIICLGIAEWRGPKLGLFRATPREIHAAFAKRRFGIEVRVFLILALVCFIASMVTR